MEELENEKKEFEKAKAERALKKTKMASEKNMKSTKMKSNTKKELKFGNDPSLSTNLAQTSLPNEDDDDYTICPGCGNSYFENWIQCGICKEWWHEGCSTYEDSGPLFGITASAYS